MKRLFSLFLSVVIILSVLFPIKTFALSDNSKNYDYLKGYLIKNGSFSDNSYCVSQTYVRDDYKMFFGIYYNVNDDEIYFCGSERTLDSTVEVVEYLYISKDYSRGYEIGLVASQTKYNYLVFGKGNLIPTEYNLGDHLNYSLTDTSYNPVTSSSLSTLADSIFKTSILAWDILLEENAKISLGNFGFTKIYNDLPLPNDNSEDNQGNNQENDDVIGASIRIMNNPGKTVQNYGTYLYLTVDKSTIPEGYTFAWYLDDEKSELTEESVYVTCFTNHILSVKLCDDNGNIVYDEYGKEISDSETIEVKTGFFYVIMAIIRAFFFGPKVVNQ